MTELPSIFFERTQIPELPSDEKPFPSTVNYTSPYPYDFIGLTSVECITIQYPVSTSKILTKVMLMVTFPAFALMIGTPKGVGSWVVCPPI
jgi:hypothetical protein